jgi:hypothetical protein
VFQREHFERDLGRTGGAGTSKSNTSNFVSSVPFRLPTAHTNLVSDALILQTTPPLPPLSRSTRFRTNSPARNSKNWVFLWYQLIRLQFVSITDWRKEYLPVLMSHSFTVPSSEDVITNLFINWRHVTALKCLLTPVNATTYFYQNLREKYIHCV